MRLLRVGRWAGCCAAVCGWFAGACSREPDAEITWVPLRERAELDGPRFRRLDPAASGLQFTNELRRENIVPYVYSGAGVAVGDYDEDGLPDVYLVSQDGANKLFRQTAPMRFEDVTLAAGGLGGGDAWGTAASFADVDGDSDLDLYVCNLESPNLLYQNQGDGTFVERAGPLGLAFVGACMGASFADYDQDGDLDLYLLTNRVFGPRLPEQIVAEVTLPKELRKTREQLFPPYPRFGSRDGKPVVPAGYEDFFFTIGDQIFAAGQRDRLLRNDGYARWTDVSDSAGIQGHGNGLSASWWDLDGDGWLDLYVANDLHSPDQLYRNQRDGTFRDVTKEALPYTAFFGMGSDFGDLDNDGRFDFCVADMSSTTHYMGKMLMGSMSDQRWFLLHADPPQQMRNVVYLNSGTPRFLEAGYLLGLASTDWTWAVRFVDLDEDGWLDFYATNGIPSFEDDPDAGMEFKRLWRLGQQQQALAIARNLEPVPERNIARRNTGALKFVDVGAEWGLDELGVSHGAAFADLDRDGDLDLVVNNQNQPASLLANTTCGTHRLLVALRGRHGNRHGIGARIELTAGGSTQTRLVTLARGFMSAVEPVEHFGLGANARVERLVLRWPGGREQTFAGLAADRLYTIREPAADAPAPAAAPAAGGGSSAPPWFAAVAGVDVRHRERDFDDYALQPLLPHRLSRLGPGLACGDVDGDGRDDLWVGGAAGQPGTLLRAASGGSFAPVAGPWQQDAECEDLGAVFVDCDRDADLDLYVVSGGIEAADPEQLRDRLYVNDGTGSFTRAAAGTLPERAVSSGAVAAGDFDRDGDLDLFVGGRTIQGRFPQAPPSALLRNDDGRYVDVTRELAPGLLDCGMVGGAVWSDYDGDGFVDLLVAAEWQPLRAFRNDGGLRLVDASAAAGLLGGPRGQWHAIAGGDLDNDGDQDYVVANLGTNSKYKADAAHPLRLYADDFDSNGVYDIVEAKYQGETLLPVRGRSCSSQAMPVLAERFPTYDAFARATLAEIYGQQDLDRSLVLAVDELRHVVLENQDGRFRVQPLPQLAQIAPGYGIGIADFDADGWLDVVIAQNSFSPEPETGRMAGGLGAVLQGGPGLQLRALPAHRSGVVVPEDGKGLLVTDLDGDGAPDFVVGCSDGPTRAFAARTSTPQLCVRLQGGAGNPAAIGARLELLLPDGRSQVRELCAGSGYLSQSSPCAFFALPQGSLPAGSRLRVRWPDGGVTEPVLPAGRGPLTIAR